MIKRRLYNQLEQFLTDYPAVALLGPRQAGKTTLALEIAERYPSIYLDLESLSDQAKLQNAELYLAEHQDKLVILDEVQRAPNLFQSLRGLIDRGRRQGRRFGRFLLLGSASIELLQQSSETLAGRIAYLELTPFDALELAEEQTDLLWLRGGFPDSVLSNRNDASIQWRQNFIRTYLERDIPRLGPRIPAETLRRFWTMLAHNQGELLNAAKLASSLGVDGKTVSRYLDLLVDLLLVRRLKPWHGNSGKRLVKSPKTYVRDSGLVHALLGIIDKESLLGHPVCGQSWEGFVIENCLSVAPQHSEAHFYRSSAGAECDLLITFPDQTVWAIEIKRSVAPRLQKGFYFAQDDVKPQAAFVVYSGKESYPISDGVRATGLIELLKRIEDYGK
ncbi:MAG: ATPase [Gammaproteobacteria bacterium HGW-Gammaproteobacteria-10]|nr:MAG: ATPase [Gammaproteobacteria bacterium HGW-Gammaproteobacteria-10]